MIAIVASRLDPEAGQLVEEWSGAGAALLSAEDLSTQGWVFRPDDPGGGIAVVQGQRVPVRDLQAVLVRRPAVLAEELTPVASTDRTYVAAEVNAFLVAWLSALVCTVVNRPTTTSLSGPAWSPMQWEVVARRAGLAWADGGGDPHDGTDVVVCGTRCVGAVSRGQRTAAATLLDASRCLLLGIGFVGDAIHRVTVAPRLTDDETRSCLLQLLRERR
jgi:hypothetical protein